MYIYKGLKKFFISEKPLAWKQIIDNDLIEFRKSDDKFVTKTYIMDYRTYEVQTVVYDPEIENKFKDYVEFKWHKPEGGVLCAICLPEKDFNEFYEELERKGCL